MTDNAKSKDAPRPKVVEVVGPAGRIMAKEGQIPPGYVRVDGAPTVRGARSIRPQREEAGSPGEG